MRYIRIEWRWERHKNMDGSPAKQWRKTVPASPQRTKAFNEQKKKNDRNHPARNMPHCVATSNERNALTYFAFDVTRNLTRMRSGWVSRRFNSLKIA